MLSFWISRTRCLFYTYDAYLARIANIESKLWGYTRARGAPRPESCRISDTTPLIYPLRSAASKVLCFAGPFLRRVWDVKILPRPFLCALITLPICNICILSSCCNQGCEKTTPKHLLYCKHGQWDQFCDPHLNSIGNGFIQADAKWTVGSKDAGVLVVAKLRVRKS